MKSGPSVGGPLFAVWRTRPTGLELGQFRQDDLQLLKIRAANS